MRIAASHVLGWPGPAEVVVDDGRITSIDALDSAPERTLAPGFVDVQVNGVDDIDVASASDDDWDRLDAMLERTGVTTWCPTLVTAPLDEMAARVRRVPTRASIAGVHLEGPFLGGRPGAHPRDLLVPIDTEWLASLPDNVRLVTLAPELAGAVHAVQDLTTRGITVSLGHSAATVGEVRDCIEAGARMVTHLFNGMPALHHREPGVVGATLTDDRVVAGLIADLVHVDPIALEIAFRAKPGRIALVTDAVAWRGARIGRIEIVHDGRAPRLPDGTLAGSSLTMDVAIRNVVEQTNVSLEAALVAASTTPANLLGLHDRGRLAVGCRADLVVLDEHAVVQHVWRGGTEVA
ncbi:MAG: N-acetylgalactosamine-6-phosphate deacetylase [Actinomycetota bacterium]|nr:N-acetylgalactosamine-6-phosphate deacetylase [Actinomycetota bacterium]